MDAAALREIERRTGLEQLASTLHGYLQSCADPAGALPRIADAIDSLATTTPELLARAWTIDRPGIARALTSLAAAAPFLLPLIVRHPEILLDLAGDDLQRPRTADEMAARLAGLAHHADPADDPRDPLRRCKYAELARITVRDLDLDLVPLDKTAETLREVSDLADVLLASALEAAARTLASSWGAPTWKLPDGDEQRAPFVVLGFGKLGSAELNYSSDVDLVYVYEHPGAELDEGEVDLRFCGERDVSPAQYFTRLAQDFGRLVTSTTSEGFLYRIDLDLRPEGAQGPLVVTRSAFVSYYDTWAATWERAACLKARPVAGDIALGWRILRELDPVLHRSSIDYEAVAAIKELKVKVEEAKGRGTPTFNVKLGPGGIRDVESVAQALQLLHAGRIPQLRQRSTQAAIESFRDVGVLDDEQADGLLDAYRFFRRTENRLQMVAERQVHALPSEPADQERLARSLGFAGAEPAAEFNAVLESHRAFCRRQFARVFPAEGPERVLDLLVRSMPAMLANPVTRPLYERLAQSFAVEIDASANPERALVNLDRFLEGLKGRRFYVGLLLDRPELMQRLAALFASSEYLSSYLAAHPRLIEPIFDDPQTLLLDRDGLERQFRVVQEEGAGANRDPAEHFLETLRLFHHRELVNIGLVDLAGKVDRGDVELALTELAEVCLRRGLELATAQLEGRADPPDGADFLVVGMGKLGSRELTYGSDLDVIFLYDLGEASTFELAGAQDYYARLAQKLIWALSTRVVTGVCYEVDARLRPSGRQGTLVTSLPGFRSYHDRGARTWERQALLRARGVAGASSLATRFDELRREILLRELDEDPAPEIHRIRRRMEGEIARESRGRRDFKTGHGGLLDVESVVQLLQLRHARTHPGLVDTQPIARQLDRLLELGLVAATDHATLSAGWEFLQRLSSRLRIVNNRSISDLNEERGDLEALALGLGYRSAQRSGGARRALLADYEEHTTAIREVYAKFFQPSLDSLGGTAC